MGFVVSTTVFREQIQKSPDVLARAGVREDYRRAGEAWNRLERWKDFGLFYFYFFHFFYYFYFYFLRTFTSLLAASLLFLGNFLFLWLQKVIFSTYTSDARPTDVQSTSDGRPTRRWTDVRRRPSDDHQTSDRRTSVGRPTDVRWSSAGRPTDVRRTLVRRTSIDGHFIFHRYMGEKWTSLVAPRPLDNKL